MTTALLSTLFENYKESHLFGRYITNDHLEPILNKNTKFNKRTLGYSVNGIPIYCITCGHGPIKILMWSQMHGNESTTTKAVLDMFNVLLSGQNECIQLLERLTIFCIPILNPDGAKLYSRNNANDIDLNRDAVDLSQPESIVLKRLFKEVEPDWCFNLHGQRTIFSAGDNKKPATLSFLAPAIDEAKSISPNRQKAMALIANLNNTLQRIIPKQIGIYDDTYNANCVGDSFQSTGVPTVLVEAGHYYKDYQREEVRKLVFYALMLSLSTISEKSINLDTYEDYMSIPPNKKLFYDIIIKKARLSKVEPDVTDIAIQYSECLINGRIEFIPTVSKISDMSTYFGHLEINAKNKLVTDKDQNPLRLSNEIDFVLVNSEKISLKA